MRKHRRAARCAKDTDIEQRQARLFTRQDFVYDAEKDHYTCPAGEP